MYLVLVTNKASNILEDLETLRLLGKVVADFVMPMEEEFVTAAAFDLIFGFDEVVATGGFKENVTAGQVRQNTEMESHEEKLHKMIVQSKINETKDLMKKKAMEIDRTKMEQMRGGPGGGRGMASVSNFGPGGGMGGGGMGGGGGGMGGNGYSAPDSSMASLAAASRAESARSSSLGGAGKKGMQLGGKNKLGGGLLESLKAEGESVEDIRSGHAAAAPPMPMPSEPVFLSIEEKISVALNKDGGLEGMEVSGTCSLTVGNEADACVKVILAGNPNPGYQFKTHPNIDKAAYSGENTLGLKDPSRPFPCGAPLGVLKWRFQTADESLVPLTINCWPSVSGGQSYVNIEYESTVSFDLHNVTIAVPIPGGGNAAPTVNSIDGEWRYDQRRSLWIWTIELLDSSNATGSAEFVVPAADANAFFPIQVAFTAPKTLCDITVAGVVGAADGLPVKYGSSTALMTESYTVE
jgi:hypothetical protein